MSKPIAGKPRPSSATLNPTEPAPTEPIPQVHPPRPRRKLLLVLGIVYAVWIAFLLVMYFTTVYPKRHPANAAPAQSSAIFPQRHSTAETAVAHQ